MKNKNLDKEINWLLKEKYNRQLTAKAQNDIKLLKKGEPLDYVIGCTDFLGCKIDLFYKPLIPRIETEFWTQKAINDILKYSSLSGCCTKNKKIKVLDMFAGSGCVGLAILKNVKNSKVTFAEIDKNCIKQIKINCKLNKINNKRYKAIKSDIFKNLKNKKYKNYFDFILANPPYIPIKNKNKVNKSTLIYEPKIALFGAQDGLFYIEKFLMQAKNYLTKNGLIYIEFDSLQKKKIDRMLKNFGYSNWQFHKDQFNRLRWVEIRSKI